MKKNIKVIMLVLIGILIGVTVGGIGVYATLTYNAGDIAYTKSGSSTQISVASALNELYQNKKETTDDVKNVTANGSITLDKYYKNVNVNVPIPAGYIQPSGTKTITTKANNIDVSNYQYANTSGMYTEAEYIAKTGEGEYWKCGSGKTTANGRVLFNLAVEYPSEIWLVAEGNINNVLTRILNRYVKNANSSYTCYFAGSDGNNRTDYNVTCVSGSTFDRTFNSNVGNWNYNWVVVK